MVASLYWKQAIVLHLPPTASSSTTLSGLRIVQLPNPHTSTISTAGSNLTVTRAHQSSLTSHR
ncbi:hypothetical protein OAG76_01970 [Rubripirellula sp.]|nr:hypothetical protein [Rubripirellula sp.]